MSKAQPSRGPWLAIVVFTLVGLGLSVYLTYLHVNVHTNPNFSSSCNINQTLNCESVALSEYAVIAGLPTSVWGILGYLLVLLVAFLGWRRRSTAPSPLHGMLFLLALCCFGAGVYFAVISFTKIKALCLYCMGTYLINILLFVLAVVALFGDKVPIHTALSTFLKWLPRHLLFLLVPGFLVVVTYLGYPKYWEARWQGVDLPKQVCGPFTADRKMAHGEDGGLHWIGAKNPKVTIVEFADYECPYCYRAHANLRALLRKCAKGIRLYHRHYPLDHKCNPRINTKFHQNACLFARAAYCAGQQDRFWTANDFLYANGKHKSWDAKKLVQSMSKLGLNGDKLYACLLSQSAKDAIIRDMAAGRDLKIQGTPFFVMNDTPYRKGKIPTKAIAKALNAPTPKTDQRDTPSRQPKPRKTEPRKSKSRKLEPRKAEPRKLEPRQTEPRKSEPRSVTPPRR